MKINQDRYIHVRIFQHIASLARNLPSEINENMGASKKMPHTKIQIKPILIPDYVRTTQIERVVCPLHIIELTRNLKKIEVSETLKIVTGNKVIVSELQSACHSLGHKTRVIENKGHNEIFVTRKK